MNAKEMANAVVLYHLGNCLLVIASTDKVTEAERKEHKRLVAREYAKNRSGAQMAQQDMFKHTMGAKA